MCLFYKMGCNCGNFPIKEKPIPKIPPPQPIKIEEPPPKPKEETKPLLEIIHSEPIQIPKKK